MCVCVCVYVFIYKCIQNKYIKRIGSLPMSK